jgi:prevent-host-death family protein
MRQISVRQLRQQASVWLRQVQTGQTFEVTDRGRPVALLTPLPDGGELDRLIAAGEVQPATSDLLNLGSPLPAKPGLPLPSQVLEEMRADER